MLLLVFLCRNNIFFWDTYQLGAKQAWALFENGLFNWQLPEEIDSGHPPIFGMYLAFFWKLFGTKLSVSHFVMLPFLWGIVYYIYKIGKLLIDGDKAILLLILVFIDACFMGQAILISPDLVLLFFMFQLIYAIFINKPPLKIISATFLGLISMRGMMILAALILFDFLKEWNLKKSFSEIKKFAVYVPPGVTVLFFLIIHYLNTGWIGYHEESEWSNAFQFVTFKELIRNLGVYTWRLMDFGRIAIWAMIFYLLRRNKAFFTDAHVFKLILLAAIIEIFVSPILIIYKGLLAHRYLLPLMLCASILFWYLLMKSDIALKKKSYILFIVCSIMLFGNVWVYPKKIAQGWDSTLAHFPYYSLRTKMIDYMEDMNIDKSKVGTVFPNIGPLKNFDPSTQENGFAEANLDTQDYIFYSNVYNDFEDEELDELENSWEIEKKYESFTVEVILYKKVK